MLDTTFGSSTIISPPPIDGVVSYAGDTNDCNGTDTEDDAVNIGTDGKVVGAGGSFCEIGGPMSPFAIRVDNLGSADTSFGGTGVVTPDVHPPGGGFDLENGELFAIGRQLSGDIILGGVASDAGFTGLPIDNNILLIALKPDGTLDSTFGIPGTGSGQLGFIELDLNNHSEDVLAAMVIDGSDRVVFGGATDGSAFVGRSIAAGGLDGAFAGSGVFVPAIGAGSINALALTTDGSIVAAGSTTVGAHTQIAVMRLTSSGALDPTFNGGAIETLGGSPFDESPAGVVVLGDGSIEIVGTTNEDGGQDIVVHRLAADGTPDAALGGDGHTVTSATDGDDAVRAVRQMADGRFVLALNVGGGSTPGPALARIDIDGVLDPTFGSGGVAPMFDGDFFDVMCGPPSLCGSQPTLIGLDLDPLQQKIVVSGRYLPFGGNNPVGFLARFWN